MKLCENKKHIASYWISRLSTRHEKEAVLEYLKKFRGTPVLGIAALRWWAQYDVGPEKEAGFRKTAHNILDFENIREPYSRECDGCETSCKIRRREE